MALSSDGLGVKFDYISQRIVHTYNIKIASDYWHQDVMVIVNLLKS